MLFIRFSCVAAYNKGIVSIRLVPKNEDKAQGRLMTVGLKNNNSVGLVRGDFIDKWYGVVPIPELSDSFWRDKEGNIVRR